MALIRCLKKGTPQSCIPAAAKGRLQDTIPQKTRRSLMLSHAFAFTVPLELQCEARTSWFYVTSSSATSEHESWQKTKKEGTPNIIHKIGTPPDDRSDCPPKKKKH